MVESAFYNIYYLSLVFNYLMAALVYYPFITLFLANYRGCFKYRGILRAYVVMVCGIEYARVEFTLIKRV